MEVDGRTRLGQLSATHQRMVESSTLRESGLDERPEIPQSKFHSAEVGMIVVADGEGDVDGVASQERRLLEAFGHVPAQGVENNSQFWVLSSQWTAPGFGFLGTADGCPVGMAARRREERKR